MNCPVCGERMREIERQGVTVDICPGCKGVWLDRGELEKIIQYETAGEAAPAPPRAEPPLPSREERPRYEEERQPRYEEERRMSDDDRRRPEERPHDRERYDRERYDHDRSEHGHYGHGRHRRKSWFENISDMFGGDD